MILMDIVKSLIKSPAMVSYIESAQGQTSAPNNSVETPPINPVKFKIDNVDYFIQINNSIKGSVTCYSTSMATALKYCLSRHKKTKLSVGCPQEMQLEDYITALTQSVAAGVWIDNNVPKYGKWMKDYSPWTVSYVQSWAFNLLAAKAKIPYRATFRSTVSYLQFCQILADTKLPQVIHANFDGISGVKGHIICGLGYNYDNKTVIAHDPWGDARQRYANHTNGNYVEYPVAPWCMSDRKRWLLWIQNIEKVG